MVSFDGNSEKLTELFLHLRTYLTAWRSLHSQLHKRSNSINQFSPVLNCNRVSFIFLVGSESLLIKITKNLILHLGSLIGQVPTHKYLYLVCTSPGFLFSRTFNNNNKKKNTFIWCIWIKEKVVGKMKRNKIAKIYGCQHKTFEIIWIYSINNQSHCCPLRRWMTWKKVVHKKMYMEVLLRKDFFVGEIRGKGPTTHMGELSN